MDPPPSNRYLLFASWQLLQEQNKEQNEPEIHWKNENSEPHPKLFGPY